MMYITGVRKGSRDGEENITHYRWSMNESSSGSVVEKNQFFNREYNRSERYMSYNPNTKHTEDLLVSQDSNKANYFTTDSRDKSVYLDKLPNC